MIAHTLSLTHFLIQFSLTVFSGVNARQSPDARSSTSKKFGRRSLIRMQVRTGLTQKQNMLREASIGGQEQRGTSGTVPKMD